LENGNVLSENYRAPLDRFPETLATTVRIELLRTWNSP
jgi:hypothetical protein